MSESQNRAEEPTAGSTRFGLNTGFLTTSTSLTTCQSHSPVQIRRPGPPGPPGPRHQRACPSVAPRPIPDFASHRSALWPLRASGASRLAPAQEAGRRDLKDAGTRPASSELRGQYGLDLVPSVKGKQPRNNQHKSITHPSSTSRRDAPSRPPRDPGPTGGDVMGAGVAR
jgi:hypothetical protein